MCVCGGVPLEVVRSHDVMLDAGSDHGARTSHQTPTTRRLRNHPNSLFSSLTPTQMLCSHAHLQAQPSTILSLLLISSACRRRNRSEKSGIYRTRNRFNLLLEKKPLTTRSRVTPDVYTCHLTCDFSHSTPTMHNLVPMFSS